MTKRYNLDLEILSVPFLCLMNLHWILSQSSYHFRTLWFSQLLEVVIAKLVQLNCASVTTVSWPQPKDVLVAG